MRMTRVRVEGFTISLDGYGAGPNQDIRNPLGVGGTDLHPWLVPTRTFQRTLFGVDGGTTGIDDDFAARGFKNVGAWILGRNMFGPIRGPWPDMNWKGWWGDNPPAFPVHVGPGTANRSEHVSSENPGANILEAPRSEVVIDPRCATVGAK